jgi:hypothetical protein
LLTVLSTISESEIHRKIDSEIFVSIPSSALVKMPLLSETLFQEVEELSVADKHKWYMLVIVTLSSMNYPDAIPEVWSHLTSHYLPLVSQDQRLLAARRIREALTKSLGIVGAARVRFT